MLMAGFPSFKLFRVTKSESDSKREKDIQNPKRQLLQKENARV